MSSEPGHVQITEFNKEAIPQVNWMMEDLFCRYGVSMPWFMLDFDFPDYSERPDWVSGYNFNLDWGPWGYWLTWFNELLGLLFDQANLPRWQMPDFSPGSWAMYNSKMSELYDESEPRICVFDKDVGVADYYIRTQTRNAAYLKRFAVQNWPQENCICMDFSNNVYLVDVAGGSWNILRKRSKEGTLLVSLTTDWTEGIAIGPDGYLYTRQLDGANEVIVKRNLDDLTAVSQISMASVSRAFTFDTDGYFYIRHSADIEKWDYDSETKIASHAVSVGTHISFAQAGDLIGMCVDGTDVYTIPTSLDESQTAWSLGWPIHIAAIDDHFLVAEYVSGDKYYKIRKYTSTGTLVWEYNIEHSDDITVYGIAAYPF